MNFKRISLSVGVMPLRNKEGIYIATPYIVEQFKENDDESSVSFGAPKDDVIIIVRDKDQNAMFPSDSPDFCAALLSGLDRLHSTEESRAIDEILAEVPDTRRDAAKQLISTRDLFSKESLEEGFDKVSEVFDKEIVSTEPLIRVDRIYKETEEVTTSINKEINKQMKMFIGGGTASSSASVDILDKYAFKKPILLLGDAGGGKTFAITKWVAEASKEEEIVSIHADGHEGFEVSDMLGMMVPNEAGGLSWVDGPVTQAFRSASKGKKTVLFMDEILRIPSRERSLLIGALIPKADGLLSIRTNRIVGYDEDGIGMTEEIKCHPSFLWTVAASNIGTGFDIEDMDTAFQDRFRAFRVDSKADLVKLIAISICKEKKFPDVLAVKIIELFNSVEEIKAEGNLQKSFSARHVSEVLTLADTVNDIGQLLEDLTYTVLSINGSGRVNEAEKEIWDSLIQDFQ